MCLTKSTRVRQLISKADRLSAFCASRVKMSAIRTRQDKATLLVTKGDNGHFRTLRAITYKKILLNKSNAILAACLHLLATFGLECRAFACKKKYHLQKSVCGGGGGGGGGGGAVPPPLSKVGGKRPTCPSPSAAYAFPGGRSKSLVSASLIYWGFFYF